MKKWPLVLSVSVLLGAVLFQTSAASSVNQPAYSVDQPAPNFSNDMVLNDRASRLSVLFRYDIEGKPGFFLSAVRDSGVEISLTKDFDQTILNVVKAKIAATTEGWLLNQVPVSIRIVQRDIKEIDVVHAQVTRDLDWWKEQGVVLANWGADYSSNSLKIAMFDYTPAKAALLTEKYGPIVTVDTRSSTNQLTPPAQYRGGV